MNVVLWRDGWWQSWEDDAWARGGVWLLPPLAGRSGRRCQLFFFILLKIHGDYWQGAGVVKSIPSSTVTGLELWGQWSHMLWLPRGFLSMQHINNCWDWWCSQLQRHLWVWNIVGDGMKNGADLKVLQGFRRWNIVGSRTKNGGVWKVRQGFWILGWVETFPQNWVLFFGSGQNRGV